MPNNRIYNRSVPFNTDAEMYVLGSIILDPNIFDSVNGKLYEEDFYDQRNQYVYRAINNLKNNNLNIGILEIIEELKRLNYADIDNMQTYLTEIVDVVPSTSSVATYIDMVEEKAIERKMLDTLQGLSDDILDHKFEFDDLIDTTEQKLTEIVRRRRTSEFVSLQQAADDTLNKINDIMSRHATLTGLDTGYPNLNKATLGFQNSDLIILAARPAVGKSSYAINLALNVATSKLNNHAHVAFFSLEMSIEQLMMRIYAYKANIALSLIRSGKLSTENLLLLNLAKQELEKINIHFDANPSSKIADIRAKCRQLKQQNKLDFVIIDYLQLITSGLNKGNRQEEVGYISRQLKMLAKELDVPILALSQLSRSIEGREDKSPQLADLRESGSIEQDADIVMFIYKRSDVEDMDDADALNEEVKKLNNTASNTEDRMIEEIISIAKNRQGPSPDFDYHFYPARCRFNEQETFKKPTGKKKKRGANGMKAIDRNNINNRG